MPMPLSGILPATQGGGSSCSGVMQVNGVLLVALTCCFHGKGQAAPMDGKKCQGRFRHALYILPSVSWWGEWRKTLEIQMRRCVDGRTDCGLELQGVMPGVRRMGVPAFRWGSEFWQFAEARVHPVQAELTGAAWFLGIPAGTFEGKPSRRVRTPGQPATLFLWPEEPPIGIGRPSR
jgi:hypothetical protein